MRVKRTAALLSVLCIVLAGFFSDLGIGLEVNASLSSEKSDLEMQKSQIEKELAQIEADLKETKNNIAEQEQYQSDLLKAPASEVGDIPAEHLAADAVIGGVLTAPFSRRPESIGGKSEIHARAELYGVTQQFIYIRAFHME